MAKIDSNIANTVYGKFLAAGLSEIDYKGKGETKGSLALAYAVLASDDNETREKWSHMLKDYHNQDEKLRDLARIKFAEHIGANDLIETVGDKERKTADYRNLVNRQYKRMQFALDLHALKFREFLIIRETAKGVVAHIKGDTDLARRVWLSRGWNDRKALNDKRSADMDILVAQRASQTGMGEVSWSQCEDMVRQWMNRTQDQTKRATVTISNKAPLGAIKAVQGIINGDPAAVAVHFSSVESKLSAIETAEDIAAFALEGDDPELVKLRNTFAKACEEVTKYHRTALDRKNALKMVA